MTRFNRREFLAKSSAMAAATALSGATVSRVSAGEKAVKPVRIGVIGTGRRGPSQITHLLAHNENVTIPAICDIKPAARARGVATVKQYGGNTPEAYGKDEYDYRNLIARDDIDGIVVVTDVQWMGKISIDGLKAGKHVGCDVTGTHSMQECFDLVKAKEASKGPLHAHGKLLLRPRNPLDAEHDPRRCLRRHIFGRGQLRPRLPPSVLRTQR